MYWGTGLKPSMRFALEKSRMVGSLDERSWGLLVGVWGLGLLTSEGW